jgi:2,3-bisphosphoglycerate-dependent phosphoglycerate mutase
MKRGLLFFFAFLLLAGCQSDRSVSTPHSTTPASTSYQAPPMPTAVPVIRAIKGNQILLADGTTQAIPHYDDPGYLIVYAARHCEKASDGTDNPSLTPEGAARAKRLGVVFDDARLDVIASTTYRRAMQTAEAVRLAAGDPVMATFTPQVQESWLAETVQEGAGKKILYIGHQNTVPAMLNHLLQKMAFPDIPSDEFGLLFVAATKGYGKTEVMLFRYE